MDKDKLKEIIEQHKLWRETNGKKGERANLTRANLYGANLYEANLTGANLYEANLTNADLYGADLTGAVLYEADLREADLREADLTRANLTGANFTRADLTRANLREADLTRADLTRANLTNANLTGSKNLYYSHIPEEGSFIAFKKVCSSKGHIILKLEISALAKRTSSIIGRKNRSNKAKVLAWLDGEKWNKKQPDFKLFSSNDSNFIYEIGKTVSVDDFNDDPRIECAPGIHFFITLQEAKDYNL